MLKKMAQKLGRVEEARATKAALSDALLKLRQKIGLELSEYKVPFDGRDVGLPIRSTHSKLWFERYRDTTQNGWHEPSVTRLLEVLAQDRKCLIDVGAHLGYFSALFASSPNRTAYAIELNPRTFQILENTLNVASGLKGHAIAINAGLSHEESETRIGSGSTSPTFSLLEGDSLGKASARSVKVTTLDLFCKEIGAAPDVIKIDVEGFERHVWLGGQDVISHYRPILIVEIHVPQLKNLGIEPFDFIREIAASNYAVFSTKDHRSTQAEPFLPLLELPQVPNFDILCVPNESNFLPDLGGLKP